MSRTVARKDSRSEEGSESTISECLSAVRDEDSDWDSPVVKIDVTDLVCDSLLVVDLDCDSHSQALQSTLHI